MEADYPGTNVNPINDGTAAVAPLPGNPGRKPWQPLFRPSGPMGILLSQLHEKAAALTSTLEIISQEAVPINILECPLKELKPTMQEMSTRARTNAAEGTRKEVQDLYEIDLKATTAIYSNLKENEANLLRIIQQGAAWSKTDIAKTGHIADTVCDLCGDPNHSIQHVIWTCPAHHNARQGANPMLASIPLEALPQSLRIGIAPAMCIFPCKPYWGNVDNDTQQDLPEDIATLIGITDTITTTRDDGTQKHNKISGDATTAINSLTDEWGDARTNSNVLAITARRALGHMRQGRFDYGAMVMPRPENDTPPTEINVFPDGGLTAPTNQHLGLPAAGIYCPNRFDATDTPHDDRDALLPQETQFEHYYTKGRDRCILLPIPGRINSSTRSEAHGLLIAICTRGAVHIGIDNQTVVERACQLLKIAEHLCTARQIEATMETTHGLAFEIARRLRKPERKHWAMQRDGDVWAAIWNVMLAKGPTAIRVSKVKGHATEKDVTEGRTTAVHRACNNVADGLVKEATALHGKSTNDLAYWLEARHRMYTTLMKDVQLFIITIIIADKEERDKRRKQANPFNKPVTIKVRMPIKLHYNIDIAQRSFNIKELPSAPHKHSNNLGALCLVHRFLRLLSIRPTMQGEPGVTWIELLVAFEAHGGKLEPALNERRAEDMARPILTIRQLLISFKSMVRFIIETCFDEIDTLFFRSSNVNGTRLRAIAIQHAVPSINCIPIWTNEVAYMITVSMLRMKCRMTRAHINSHAAGTLDMTWSSLNLKGAPPWRASTSQGPTFTLTRNARSDNHLPLHDNSNNELSLIFACPKCTCTRDISKCSLLVRSGWGHILCFACRATSRSMTWQCCCGVPWHSCNIHSCIVRKEVLDEGVPSEPLPDGTF